MQPQTLNDIFQSIAEHGHERVMLAQESAQWKPITARELHCYVLGVARAFRKWGLEKGDRVAILSENRPEWAIADFASFLVGGAVVPIYATLTADQTAYILADSQARIAVVSSLQQLEKVISVKNQTALERILIMDAVETSHAIQMRELMNTASLRSDSALEAYAHTITADDLASIVYTSGTTGTAKGVQLTHGNLTSNVLHSMEGFEVSCQDISVSFLPLSHVTARHADLALLYHHVTLAYCARLEELPEILLEVRPTVFVGVPRVYEKIYSQVRQAAESRAKRAIYRWALSVGCAHQQKVLTGETPASPAWKLADWLLFSKVRARLGGRVRIFVSGGAPLGAELAQWYASIGIRIHEGYGLTETSPVIAINTPRAYNLGTVGRPLRNVEVKIAGDGEILVRGPSVFRTYWNNPQETRDAFADGWFKTGDVGSLDQEGFLSVTDRKKDLLKTSGGKFIAPQPLENSLKLHNLIGTAVVLGDRRKFACVIIAPHFSLLEEWARRNHISFSSREDLVSHREINALYESIVAEVNKGLARYEKLKKILLVPHEFSANDGTLTPTLKLRRKAIEERYRRQIDELYEAAEVSKVA